MKKLIFIFMLAPGLAFGMDRMCALSMLETGDNDYLVGKAGEISRYQIMKREWKTVTSSPRYTDPAIAKAVADILSQKRVNQFRAVHGRDPNDFEFYVLWNAPAQALRAKISPVVAERAERFANLCTVGRAKLNLVAQTHTHPKSSDLLRSSTLARMN